MKLKLILGTFFACLISTASFAALQQDFTVNFGTFSGMERPDIHFDFKTNSTSGHGDIASKQIPRIATIAVSGSSLTLTNLTFNSRSFQPNANCQNIDLAALQKQSQSSGGNIYVRFYAEYTKGTFYCITSIEE